MAWYGYALLAALCIAVVGLIQKRILREEHSLEYVALFSTIRLLLVLIIFGSQISWTINLHQAGLLLGGAGFGAIAFFLTIKALRRFEYSTITPIMALEPGIVAILGVATLGELFSPGKWLGVALLTLGAYLITLFSEPRDWKQVLKGPGHFTAPIVDALRRPGGWFIWVALALYSVSALFARRVLAEVSVPTYLFYDILILTIVYTAAMVMQKQRVTAFSLGRRHLVAVIVVIAFVHLLNGWFQSVALTMAPVALVVALKRTSTLLDVAIGGRLFHEHRLWQKLAAAGIIVAGTLLIVIS